ncbi:long-chain-fatty-acid--CoA ligase [Gordonia jinghuaiqii]|uniref:Long-chain-fatty-acid--CoA ligase n=1 Tax=Gordonia jinghuaiqii TaxID=2758710 RepID=A0A7D7LV37_9ACTN|nr:long-chain-fatty-acid--CoA ligase [Gordonia jinghuaiqii]MCR5978772.1 long-chain-fatty-acid--CoA ligase [Gordonia jinghuaiqii]QMT03077.1 long-chain-fatty-acid--CoA ligase [Gordonia jinghuaiqii]
MIEHPAGGPSAHPLVITDFLYRARDMFGDKEIVDHVDGVEVFRYTYREYADRVLRLASALIASGVAPGDRVGTLAWNHRRHLELYLAVPLAGAVLHTINIRLSPAEIAYIVDHADDTMIFADPSLEHLLDDAREQRPGMPVVQIDDGSADSGRPSPDSMIEAAEPLAAPVPRADDDLAVLCYTSGTTGAPKGVGYSHKSLYLHTMAACLADGHAISERDRALLVVPMFHANAWGVPFAALMSGADQILPGPHPTPAHIAGIIAAERVTYTGMVPTVAVDLLAHARRAGTDLTSLRALVLGGSTPTLALIRDLEQLGIPVFQGWGMTEISPMATFSRPPAFTDDDPERRWEHIRKQGRLLPGLQWKLVDDGEVMPHDGISRGEILIRGPWVATAYYRAEHPERFDDGWLRTGDIGVIDEHGYLTIVDRTKDLIKSGGEWISSVALEEALLEHPGVHEAAVVSVPHPRWQERPVAYVVGDAGLDTEAVRDELATRIPRWWVPELIVVVGQLPRTSVGKLDKRSLREQAAGTRDLWEPTTAADSPIPVAHGDS